MNITINLEIMATRFWTYDYHKFYHLFNIKIDLSYHLFIKDDIFEVTVKFPPIGTPVVIITQYC